VTHNGTLWPRILTPSSLQLWYPRLVNIGNSAIFGPFGTTGPTSLNVAVTLISEATIPQVFSASLRLVDDSDQLVLVAARSSVATTVTVNSLRWVARFCCN
jgi:hypothetical protein